MTPKIQMVQRAATCIPKGRPVMRTREIGIDDWSLFCNDFTRLHHGERVSVETLGERGLGVTAHVHDLPLVGIVAADPADGAGEWIEILAGDSGQSHAAHSVLNPIHIRLAEEDNGQVVALQIESAKGMTTMIRFEHACQGMPPGYAIA